MADAPVGVIDEEICDMADFTVGCVDMKSNHGIGATEMRIALLSIFADRVCWH